MAHFKTVCEAPIPKFNDKGEQIDSETHEFYLLYWGLKYDIIHVDSGSYPVSYTVCFCQEMQTGEIYSILPEQVKVIGVKKQ